MISYHRTDISPETDFKAHLASINQDLITRKILVNDPPSHSEIDLYMMLDLINTVSQSRSKSGSCGIRGALILAQ